MKKQLIHLRSGETKPSIPSQLGHCTLLLFVSYNLYVPAFIKSNILDPLLHACYKRFFIFYTIRYAKFKILT